MQADSKYPVPGEPAESLPDGFDDLSFLDQARYWHALLHRNPQGIETAEWVAWCLAAQNVLEWDRLILVDGELEYAPEP